MRFWAEFQTHDCVTFAIKVGSLVYKVWLVSPLLAILIIRTNSS